jgi:hypothetical protein
MQAGKRTYYHNWFCAIVVLQSNRKENRMESAKEEVIQLIRRLPDDTTLEEIQYHLYVQEKVQRGIRDVEAGKVYSQEEVEKRMKRWVSE